MDREVNANQEYIERLVASCSSQVVKSISEMPITASNRKYFRLILNNDDSLIAVFNEDVRENVAFFTFAQSLKQSIGRVPEVLAISDDQKWYLQTDLGNDTLYSVLVNSKENKGFEDKRRFYYQSIIKDLVQIQTESYFLINFDKSYPRSDFDKQSISWDLNYFKYYFLKFSGINFDEQLLEDDYRKLIKCLLKEPSDYFMYRDFQSRNIMLYDDSFYYIDFQGGRKGPLQYDLASLLFNSKADLPNDFKLEMLDYYFDLLPESIRNQQKAFKQIFWYFALIRIMQAMGAYGFRGLFEKKQYFIKSIPLALENLDFVLEQLGETDISYLVSLLKKLKTSAFIKKYLPQKQNNKLRVKISSFSYKKGLPKDCSHHGGGFVFDCRSIHNPGRYEEYKQLTGKDKPVQDFFLAAPSMDAFLAEVYELVDASVRTYIERDFDYLAVHFGCTGGQHRSVYSAENLKQHLSEKFNINIELSHREIG